MNTLYIGHNINFETNICETLEEASDLNCNFYQVFLENENKKLRQSHKDLMKVGNELKEKNMKIVVHGSFMLNFCHPHTSNIHNNALRLLITDLRESILLNAIGVIVHMGKKIDMSEEVAIDNYVRGIKTALKFSPPSSTIIFETGAGQGTEICTSIYELGKLYRRFTKEEQKRIKFCIDTCHVYVTGCDLSSQKYIDLFCFMLDVHLGWENIVCIHLNDSKCTINNKKDRHADLGHGFIKLSGLQKFIKICYEKNIPIVLETPCDVLDKKHQIDLVKNWIN